MRVHFGGISLTIKLPSFFCYPSHHNFLSCIYAMKINWSISLRQWNLEISRNVIIQNPDLCRISCSSGKILLHSVSYDFYILFGILAKRIIKVTKNETGLDRLENEWAFTVDIKEQSNNNMQASGLKFLNECPFW